MSEKSQVQNLLKISSGILNLLHAEERTDMIKVLGSILENSQGKRVSGKYIILKSVFTPLRRVD